MEGPADCGVSRNICNTVTFFILYISTFAIFTITYIVIWGNLYFMTRDGFNTNTVLPSVSYSTNAAEWLFITCTWLGFALGGCMTYTIFKTVESLKVRGFFLCALLIPQVIFSQYLNWTLRRQNGTEGIQ